LIVWKSSPDLQLARSHILDIRIFNSANIRELAALFVREATINLGPAIRLCGLTPAEGQVVRAVIGRRHDVSSACLGLVPAAPAERA
jgi:hypothetical protein